MESRNTPTPCRKLPGFSALRAFEQAVLSGSFKEAAHHLSLSTSAVSHQIRLLEKQLGQTLFLRHAHGVTPTPAAAYYLTVVQSAFNQLEHGTRQLQQMNDGGGESNGGGSEVNPSP